MLFANPFIGGMYGFVSYGRKMKRMSQAGQRQAATNMSAAMRAEARRLMTDTAGSDAAYKAGLDMLSEADYVKKLADEGNKKAAKASNAFEMADELLDQAGFGKINIGGQAFRAGFGDDPRFIEQIQREVSANNWAQSVLRGAQKSVQRDIDALSYTTSNVLEYSTKAERRKFFDERWSDTIARFSSASGTDEFFNIVWGNQAIQTRVERLSDLLKNDEALFDSIVSDKKYMFNDDVDFNTVAEFIVKEYEGILQATFLRVCETTFAAARKFNGSKLNLNCQRVFMPTQNATLGKLLKNLQNLIRSLVRFCIPKVLLPVTG